MRPEKNFGERGPSARSRRFFATMDLSSRGTGGRRSRIIRGRRTVKPVCFSGQKSDRAPGYFPGETGLSRARSLSLSTVETLAKRRTHSVPLSTSPGLLRHVSLATMGKARRSAERISSSSSGPASGCRLCRSNEKERSTDYFFAFPAADGADRGEKSGASPLLAVSSPEKEAFLCRTHATGSQRGEYPTCSPLPVLPRTSKRAIGARSPASPWMTSFSSAKCCSARKVLDGIHRTEKENT